MSGDENQPDRGFTLPNVESGQDLTSEPDNESGAQGAIPAIDFSTFVLSLGTSALYQLGQLGDSKGGGEPAKASLLIARQTIDTLEMVSTKTQGNLDAEEIKLLESILYELHLRFVEAREKHGEGNG
jgi:hypothetical protein